MSDTITSIKEYSKLFDVEVEQAILGAILYNSDYMDRVRSILDKDDFYEPVHRIIFEQYEKIVFKSNLVADSVVLKNFFINNEAISKIGGEQYLLILLNKGSGIVNIDSYAKIVKEFSNKRKLVDIGRDIIFNTQENDEILSSNKIIEDASNKLYQLVSDNNHNTEDFNTVLKQYLGVVEEITIKKEDPRNMSTGYYAIDEKLDGGFKPGWFVVIGGRSSMGKTTFALNLVYNIAEKFHKNGNKYGVGVFSLEQPAVELSDRLVSIATGEFNFNILKNKLKDKQTVDLTKLSQHINEINQLKIYINDVSGSNMVFIRSEIRRMVQQYDVKIVFIDYIQIINTNNTKYRGNKVYEVQEITMELKNIAKEFDIAIVALSQLSRDIDKENAKDGENPKKVREPVMSDLRDSGSIEQDADVVMFIHRPWYYIAQNIEKIKPEERDKYYAMRHDAHILISKNRHGETAVGTESIKLHFKEKLFKLENVNMFNGAYNNIKKIDNLERVNEEDVIDEDKI